MFSCDDSLYAGAKSQQITPHFAFQGVTHVRLSDLLHWRCFSPPLQLAVVGVPATGKHCQTRQPPPQQRASTPAAFDMLLPRPAAPLLPSLAFSIRRVR